jgi:hypothetical protein
LSEPLHFPHSVTPRLAELILLGQELILEILFLNFTQVKTATAKLAHRWLWCLI